MRNNNGSSHCIVYGLLRKTKTHILFTSLALLTSSVGLLILSVIDIPHSRQSQLIAQRIADLSWLLINITFLIYIFSGMVKGVAGIGMGLLPVPTVSLVFDPVNAICLVSVPLIATNIWQGVIRGKVSHTLNQYKPLVVTMTLVMIITAYLADSFPIAAISLIMGLIAIAFALLNLGIQLPKVPKPLNHIMQVFCGTVAGFVGGVTGLVVIPLVLYMISRRITKEDYVPVLGLLFLISGVVLVLCLGLCRFDCV